MKKFWVEQVLTGDNVEFAVFTWEGEDKIQFTWPVQTAEYAENQAADLEAGKRIIDRNRILRR